VTVTPVEPIIFTNLIQFMSWAAQSEGMGGQSPSHFWDQRGTGGIQRGGPMKMIFASTADSLYSVLYK